VREAGFRVPESLVTNDPDEVLAFVAYCREAGDDVIYKSVSGTRSIVQTFGEEDRARLGRIRACPTQFQRRVRGTDIRVHVVGRSTFAVRIESCAVDYRYSVQQTGEDAELVAADVPEAVEQACIALSERLDLPFTGIDLRVTPEGDYYCFEANPCPAYSYYQRRTGLPIADALVRWLAGVRS
jgi:glutathione synthase/RimK-type ligase-like ATP-grasp enzyme